jgi:hypothetical protein
MDFKTTLKEIMAAGITLDDITKTFKEIEQENELEDERTTFIIALENYLEAIDPILALEPEAEKELETILKEYEKEFRKTFSKQKKSDEEIIKDFLKKIGC